MYVFYRDFPVGPVIILPLYGVWVTAHPFNTKPGEPEILIQSSPLLYQQPELSLV